MLEDKELSKYVKDLGKELKDNPTVGYVEVLRTYGGDDQIIGAKEYMAILEEARKDITLLRIPSGLPSLDSIIEAFWEGNLIVVSGPTKEGKTTFCQTLTINFSKMGMNCLWFSFDTPAEELISRFNEEVNIYLPQRIPAEKKLEWLEKRIIEGIAKFGTRVVFIDHLAMLTRHGGNPGNYATELQTIVMELKQIAIRWRVLIFVNHHIRKIQSDSIPLLSDLKDSSGVAQDSDMVIMIWRKKGMSEYGLATSNEAVLAVMSNRRTGRTGFVNLIHGGDRFIEVDMAPPKHTASPIKVKEDVDVL